MFLNKSQVADLIGVSTRTIDQWRAEDKIPFVTLPSGRCRFNKETILRWLSAGSPRPRSAHVVEG